MVSYDSSNSVESANHNTAPLIKADKDKKIRKNCRFLKQKKMARCLTFTNLASTTFERSAYGGGGRKLYLLYLKGLPPGC